MKEANEAVSLAGSQLERATVDGTTLISSSSIDVSRRRRGASVELLPPFDEYTVAYKERSAVIDAAHTRNLNAGGGMLNAVIVVNGRVTGTWKRHLRRDDVEITASLFRQLTPRETHLLEKEAARYAAFVGRRTAVIIEP